MSGLDWNVELKKIEREFVGLPPEPKPGELHARRASELRAQQREEAVNASIGAAGRVLLLAALVSALYFWPSARTCGLGLFAYMGAEATIGIGALWVAVYSWRHRMAKTHGLAFAMLIGGLALLAVEILPRVGYARMDAGGPQQWWCAESIT